MAEEKSLFGRLRGQAGGGSGGDWKGVGAPDKPPLGPWSFLRRFGRGRLLFCTRAASGVEQASWGAWSRDRARKQM